MADEYYLLKCRKEKDANGYPLKVTGNGRVIDMADMLDFKRIHRTACSALYCGNFAAANFAGYDFRKDSSGKFFNEGNNEDLFVIHLDYSTNNIEFYHKSKERYIQKVDKKKALEQKLGAESWAMAQLSVM